MSVDGIQQQGCGLMRRVGELFAGRFAIEREAGSGGMGTVYAARDLHTDRPVALKLLQLGGSFAGDVERFSREAAVLAELDHPGIVSHVAHGTAPDGQRYLAMEWLEGEDLGQRLRRGPLPITDTLTLLRQVAAALALAHRRGLVHRGLCRAHKPARNHALMRAEKWRGKQKDSLSGHSGWPPADTRASQVTEPS